MSEKQSEVELLRDEVKSLRMQVREEIDASEKRRESLSQIIDKRCREIERLQGVVRDFCTAAKVILPMVQPQHQTEYMRELLREHDRSEKPNEAPDTGSVTQHERARENLLDLDRHCDACVAGGQACGRHARR